MIDKTGSTGWRGPISATGRDPREALFAAQQYLETGNLKEAERLLQSILTADPQHVRAMNLLGVVALRAGDPAAAESILRRATALDARNPDCHCNFGTALLSLGNSSEAETALREAVRLRSSHPMANYNLGLIELNSDRFADAARHLAKTVRGAPRNADALNVYGIALSKAGNFRQASLRRIIMGNSFKDTLNRLAL